MLQPLSWLSLPGRIGDVLRAQGDGDGALAAFRDGMAIAERLARQDPGNAQWQRDLSVSHDRIGDVLRAQGDGGGTLAAFRDCQTALNIGSSAASVQVVVMLHGPSAP